MALNINPGNVLNMMGYNFNQQNSWKRDIFVACQDVFPTVGDIKSGKADKFLNRAYKQQKLHTNGLLSKAQEDFIEENYWMNTPGRGEKNYNRMEYDFSDNPNGKSAENDRKEAEAKTEINKNDMLDYFKKNGYTICTTATSYGTAPITQEDYKDQIKLR
jgi:hypothetical protein